MLKQKTQDVEVGGKMYRLNKLDARTGSYIAAKVALMAAPMLKNGTVSEDSLAAVVPSLNRRDFDELQTLLLQKVQRLNEVEGRALPEPVLTNRGDFVDPELAYDVASVMALTVKSVMFNIGDFFAVAGLTKPAE